MIRILAVDDEKPMMRPPYPTPMRMLYTVLSMLVC